MSEAHIDSSSDFMGQFDEQWRERLRAEFPKRMWGLNFATLEDYEASVARRDAAQDEVTEAMRRAEREIFGQMIY